jgi:hypothetical protein
MRRGEDRGLDLFDLATQTFTAIPLSVGKKPGWGEDACSESIVGLTFMPDNLTWTPDGKILAAGIKGIGGNCPPDSNYACIQGFVLAEVDPIKMESRILYDNNGKALINGVSVALEAAEIAAMTESCLAARILPINREYLPYAERMLWYCSSRNFLSPEWCWA